MKTLFFIICGFFTIAFSQKIQITNIHGADCSNFTSLPYPNTQGYYAFEAKVSNVVDIYLGQYNGTSNVFTTLKRITDNNAENRFPNLFMWHDTLYIVYQAAITGLTKIGYKTYVNGTVSDFKIISGNIQIYSTNPALMKEDFTFGTDSVYVYFRANNSIYFKSVFSDEEPLEIFSGDMDVQFSFASFANVGNDIYAAAIWKGFGSPGNYIQVKKRTNYNWNYLFTFSGNKENDNLRFVKVDYTTMLAWDIDSGMKKDIYLMPALNDTTSITLMRDNYPYSNFDFHADQNIAITENIPVMYSNAFKVLINDSLFIRVNEPEIVFNAPDTLVYTPVKNTSLYVGSLGSSPLGAAFFTVWEDSTEDNIQLFGRRSIEVILGVNDKTVPGNFILQQNYPNPFNPSTKIKYTMPASGNVQVKIYDALGREVAVLVNGYRNAGAYEVEFNAGGLASGVYLYRITIGGYTQTKKMLLLR